MIADHSRYLSALIIPPAAQKIFSPVAGIYWHGWVQVTVRCSATAGRLLAIP